MGSESIWAKHILKAEICIHCSTTQWCAGKKKGYQFGDLAAWCDSVFGYNDVRHKHWIEPRITAALWFDFCDCEVIYSSTSSLEKRATNLEICPNSLEEKCKKPSETSQAGENGPAWDLGLTVKRWVMVKKGVILLNMYNYTVYTYLYTLHSTLYTHSYMYICIYVYMYICIYVYMYICIYVYMYICIYVYMYICIYVYMYICIYVYMYICIYVYMYICIYVYIYMYICIYVYMYIFIYVYMYICVYVYMYICICIYIYILYCIYNISLLGTYSHMFLSSTGRWPKCLKVTVRRGVCNWGKMTSLMAMMISQWMEWGSLCSKRPMICCALQNTFDWELQSGSLQEIAAIDWCSWINATCPARDNESPGKDSYEFGDITKTLDAKAKAVPWQERVFVSNLGTPIPSHSILWFPFHLMV